MSSRSTPLVVIIVIAAIGLSFVSYQYSSLSARQILDLGSEEARSNAKIQAHDLSAVLANKIESASDNLETIASSKTLQNQDIEGAIPLLNAAQKSSADITSSYSWLDEDGKIVWATSFSNATLRQQFTGADFSYREYYSQPRDTLKPYFSTLIESIDSVPRLTISYPIIGKQIDAAEGSSTFKGVVVAGIEVNALGKFVQEQLVPDYKSSVGLIDRNGIILYSSSSSQYVGKSIFGPEIQSILQPDVKEPFNQFIRDSLTGKTGSGDFTSQGKTSTVAYNPVTIKGNEFAIMYIVTPHEFAGTVVALVEQQRTLNSIIIVGIGAVSAGIAALVLTWNKRLERMVSKKTSELISRTEELEISNRNLEKAYEDLKIHEKLQTEFVNIAAHELRTPIQPLLGAAELIESQFQGKDKIEVTHPEIEMILRNAKRLERLSSDILEVSRIESGALRLNRETFSLAYIIAGAVKDAMNQSNFKPDKLTIRYHADDIFVHADREKTIQVITNLLTNAIKFTDEGTISVTTQRDKDNKLALVTVRDSGSGIDSDIVSKLFEKFATKSERGTGIGLYISKKIVEAHGGNILGENNLDGPGATFKFTIPLAEDIKTKQLDSFSRNRE
ncbi:MAG: sensor histidine kinase [Thaumarchaeota archaeon]|nr:MAG: sensor histidine kinase [Nitrososphaerota archaeon]